MPCIEKTTMRASGTAAHSVPDEAIHRLVDGEHAVPGGLRRGQPVERVTRVHAVPERLERGVELAHDHE